MLELLPTVMLLLHDASADQTRAVLSYLRMCASTLPLQELHQPAVLSNLLSGFTTALEGSPHKAKVSSRCRAIMRKLVNRLGDEVVAVYVPNEDQPLLEYVSRQSRRAERRQQRNHQLRLEEVMGSDSESDTDSATASPGGAGEAMEEDSDGEEDNFEEVERGGAKPGNKQKKAAVPKRESRPKAVRATDAAVEANRTLPSSLEDLLEDSTPTLFGKSSRGKQRQNKARSDTQDEEAEGYTVVVTEDGLVKVTSAMGENRALTGGSMSGKKRNRDDGEDEHNPVGVTDHHEATRSVRENQSEQENKKKRKLNLKEPGLEYRSNKAGGDVKRKGMLDPHAFIPLDARLLSRKNFDQAVSHFGVVVRSGSKKKLKNQRKHKGKKK